MYRILNIFFKGNPAMKLRSNPNSPVTHFESSPATCSSTVPSSQLNVVLINRIQHWLATSKLHLTFLLWSRKHKNPPSQTQQHNNRWRWSCIMRGRSLASVDLFTRRCVLRDVRCDEMEFNFVCLEIIIVTLCC